MSEQPPPAWIHWPIRVLAVVFVLPFRLLWELFRLIGRFLARYVGRPLAWLWHYAVAVPAAFLWRYLVVVPAAWLWQRALRPALEWLARWLIVVPAQWLWRHRRQLLRPFALVLHYLLVVSIAWLWAVTAPLWRGLGRGLWWVLTGLGRGIAAVLTAGWRGAGWLLCQLYRWVLRPAGLAIAWCWRRTVVPVWRALTAAGRRVHASILRPGADAARAVLVSVGVRR
jgi:hypothetical protein